MNAILIYNAYNCPPDLLAHAPSPDDLDYVTVIPDSSTHYPYALEDLGCCSNDRVELEDGRILLFAYHA